MCLILFSLFHKIITVVAHFLPPALGLYFWVVLDYLICVRDYTDFSTYLIYCLHQQQTLSAGRCVVSDCLQTVLTLPLLRHKTRWENPDIYPTHQ